MKTSHLLPPPGWVFNERISFEDSPEEERGRERGKERGGEIGRERGGECGRERGRG